MFLLYVTLFRTLNTILENKRSNAHIGTFKTNEDAMWHTEHEVWEGDESLVAVFTAFFPHARSARFPEDSLFMYAIASARQSPITLRMARKIQFKQNYLIVQYCTPAHIWPWYNRHLWITDLVNSKFFPLWVGWTTCVSWKHNSCSRWNQDCRRQHDGAWRDRYLLCIHSTLWFCTSCRRGFFPPLISQFSLGPVRNFCRVFL